MDFDFVAAVVAGLVGTAAMTGMMIMAPNMGMPEMDMPKLLGSMFGAPGDKKLGLFMHFLAGIVFAIIYGFFFTVTGTYIIAFWGFVIGIAHWLIVGYMMGPMMPMMHKGIKSGDVPEPGIFMIKMGGAKGFMGGLLGHIVFGVVVAIVYGLIA